MIKHGLIFMTLLLFCLSLHWYFYQGERNPWNYIGVAAVIGLGWGANYLGQGLKKRRK